MPTPLGVSFRGSRARDSFYKITRATVLAWLRTERLPSIRRWQAARPTPRPLAANRAGRTARSATRPAPWAPQTLRVFLLPARRLRTHGPGSVARASGRPAASTERRAHPPAAPFRERASLLRLGLTPLEAFGCSEDRGTTQRAVMAC